MELSIVSPELPELADDVRRPKVSIFLGLSLDGFIADVGGGIDWLHPYSGGGADGGYAEFFASVDCMLIGRKSWESVLTFDPWPYGDMRMLVRTTHPLAPTHGEEAVAGPIAPILGRLRGEGVRHVYVDGGQTARDALIEGVVDEVTLTWIPEVLGRGIPLFGVGILPPQRWTLTATRLCGLGMAQATYVPRPDPEAGGYVLG